MNAFQIAYWFMSRSRVDEEINGGDKLSLLKLEKLLYYAEGYALVAAGESLFPEKIVAWKHGPVVVEVHDAYKETPYDLPLTDSEKQEALLLSVEVKARLEEVYQYWGEYSAWGLRNQAHKETPWLVATMGGTVFGSEIERPLIRAYFQRNYLE